MRFYVAWLSDKKDRCFGPTSNAAFSVTCHQLDSVAAYVEVAAWQEYDGQTRLSSLRNTSSCRFGSRRLPAMPCHLAIALESQISRVPVAIDVVEANGEFFMQ